MTSCAVSDREASKIIYDALADHFTYLLEIEAIKKIPTSENLSETANVTLVILK